MPFFEVSKNNIEGIPIANIYTLSGDYQRLYIVDGEPDDTTPPEHHLGNLLHYDTTCRRIIREHEREALLDAISLKKPPSNSRLQAIYNLCMAVLDEVVGREIRLDNDAVMQPLPNTEPNQVDQLFVAGPSGAGKSTYIANFLIEYKEIHPDNDIYLFSRKDTDEALDAIPGIKRVKIGQDLYELLKAVNNLEIFKDTACIFDDIDTIPDKQLLEFIKKLRDDLLETGRSHNITVITTSHQILNWKNTRNMLNESSAITVFPSRGSTMQIQTLLKNYMSLDSATIARIIKSTGRWVTIYKKSPQYVIYEHGAFFIK